MNNYGVTAGETERRRVDYAETRAEKFIVAMERWSCWGVRGHTLRVKLVRRSELWQIGMEYGRFVEENEDVLKRNVGCGQGM